MIRGGPETAAGGLPWPTGPQALLLKAAVGPDEQVEASFAQWRSMVDIEDHVDGGTFRLFPMVFLRMQSLGAADPLMGRLKGVYRRAWVENNQLFADVAPAVAALEAGGVRTMILKGAPLAFAYYASHAARPMFDLDVVVPAAQAGQAMAVLQAQGWSQGSHVRPHELPETHAVDFRNAEGRELDLHWHCLREAPSPVADAWFWDTAEAFDFRGVSTRQPAPTAMLLHLVVHGVRSNLEPPIRWIADAATLIRGAGNRIEWDELVRFARSQRLTYRLHLGLDYLARTYQLPIPPAVLADLEAEGLSLVERIENVVYLGRADMMYRPRLYPLLDYWRFLRNESLGRFLLGYPDYLRRRWQLPHAGHIPLEAASALKRKFMPS